MKTKQGKEEQILFVGRKNRIFGKRAKKIFDN